jgi:membrane-associated phospholipid phosphatase
MMQNPMGFCMKWIFKKLIELIIVMMCNPTLASSTLETVGDIGQIALPITALSTTLFKSDIKGFSEFAYSFFLSTGSVQLLKHTVHRERPNHGSQSFPSGHTANGFVAASFLQFRYGWQYGIPAYTAAAITGYSRIQAKKHWTTDVLVGAVIGIGSSFLFTDKYMKKVEITPYYHPDNKEMGITATAQLS